MKVTLLAELGELIAVLEQPLSSLELTNGWTSQSQSAILSLLRNLREAIRFDRTLPELNIGRGLDHWGIEGGPLIEKICAVSNELRDRSVQK